MKNQNAAADILTAARKARTAAEFGAVVETLQQVIGDVGSRRKALDGEREAAVFGEGDLAKVRRASADADQDMETLQAALAGALRRRDEALKVERQEAAVDLGAAAKAKGEEFAKTVQAFRDSLNAAREANVQMVELRRDIGNINVRLDAVGRRDLEVSASAISSAILDRTPAPISGLGDTGRRADDLLRELLGPRSARSAATLHPAAISTAA